VVYYLKNLNDSAIYITYISLDILKFYTDHERDVYDVIHCTSFLFFFFFFFNKITGATMH
jgi:hypothetical protein